MGYSTDTFVITTCTYSTMSGYHVACRVFIPTCANCLSCWVNILGETKQADSLTVSIVSKDVLLTVSLRSPPVFIHWNWNSCFVHYWLLLVTPTAGALFRATVSSSKFSLSKIYIREETRTTGQRKTTHWALKSSCPIITSNERLWALGSCSQNT
jgi:hypothetical protein